MKLRWTEKDFGEMSWHDNCVHALRIVEGEHGGGELILDLDYILRWDCSKTICEFEIAPAELRFEEVRGLRVNLDYAGPSAGLAPFSLDRIEREPIEYVSGFRSFKWIVKVSWPTGEIGFEASKFRQEIQGDSVITTSQCLSAAERDKLRKGV